MKFLRLILLFLVCGSAFGATSVDHEIHSDWDSLRFGLGILGSDYYMEDPVIVVTPTENGATLVYNSPGKRVSISQNKKQFEELLTRLSTLFADATPPPKDIDHKVSPFTLLISMDFGFFHKVTYMKGLSYPHNKGELDGFSNFARGLFPKLSEAEQGAAANP